MPKATYIQTNWTGGELSPLLYSRIDAQKYANGAKTIENFIVVPSGGVKKRRGSKFVWYSRVNNERSRLIPFVYNADQAYMLEFSNNCIRLFADQGIVTETAQNITGITKANPAVVTYAGSDTYANGDRVVISGVTGMTEVNNREFTVANVNAGANTFELSGINSSGYTTYVSGGTVAEIVEITTTYSGTECQELSFTQSADTLFIAHGSHALAKLVRNSATSWTLSAVDPLRGPWRSFNNDETVTVKANDVTGTVTLTASASLFSSTHVGALWKLYTPTRTNGESEFGIDSNVAIDEYWSYNGSVFRVDAVVGTVNSTKLTPPTHKQGTITLYESGSAATDNVDVTFKHQGYGIVEIATYVSATEVTATVYSGYGYSELPLQLADPGMTGGLATNDRYTEPTKFWQEGAWSDVRGHPDLVTFFEQRLVATQNQTVFASVSGNFADFEEGANDDQALNYTIASEQADVIRWIMPGKQLLIGTTSGEYVMAASSLGEALTPTNVKISRETTYGSSECKPVRVGNAVLFMQRRGDPENAGRKMREMAYSFEIDGYASNDLTIFAPHITGTGVTELCYQADPDNIVWGVREDGAMCALTYERSQEVTAWHRHILGGYGDASNGDAVVEQVAAIPGADGDELWLKVKRYVDGGVVRYIEVLTYFDDETALADGVFVDSAITYSGSATAALSGLWHLRGQPVAYLANGVAGTGTVSATGTLAVTAGTTKCHVGFAYTSKLETLDIEAGAAAGTAQTRQKRIANAYARLVRSQGGAIGVEGSTDDIPYSDATLFTGDKAVAMRSGWGGSGSVYVEHSDPLPFTLTALIMEINTSG